LTASPFDLAANAARLLGVLRCATIADFRANYAAAAASDHTTVYIETDSWPNPPGSAWWDVPVSQLNDL
jgi:3D-(3,5/4)-trihydroxycyclohexane-1,2-dione acylhydrolase (decyclizing)